MAARCLRFGCPPDSGSCELFPSPVRLGVFQLNSDDGFYSKGYSPTDPWTVACIRYGPTKRTRASGPRVRQGVALVAVACEDGHFGACFPQFFGFSDPVTIAMIRALPGYEILQGLADSLPGGVSLKA
jgi:hypothetical protein